METWEATAFDMLNTEQFFLLIIENFLTHLGIRKKIIFNPKVDVKEKMPVVSNGNPIALKWKRDAIEKFEFCGNVTGQDIFFIGKADFSFRKMFFDSGCDLWRDLCKFSGNMLRKHSCEGAHECLKFWCWININESFCVFFSLCLKRVKYFIIEWRTSNR